MNTLRFAGQAVLLALLVCGGSRGCVAADGGGCFSCFGNWPACARYCGPCCADDYCAKPIPCVPCAKNCGCDDYCGKPAPQICIPCPKCTCDDYCRKPLPCFCWPAPTAKYTCGPCAAPSPQK